MERVGFLSGLVTKTAASVTKRFVTLGLTIFIQGRTVRIVSHAHRTRLVDRSSAVIEAVRGWAIGRDRGGISSAAGFDDGAERLLHILCHFDFVVARPPVKTQHWYAPFIHCGRVEFTICIFVGQHLAQGFHPNGGAVRAAAMLLQGGAVAFALIAGVVELLHHGHEAAAAGFDVIAAQEFVLAVELPPRHVHVRQIIPPLPS